MIRLALVAALLCACSGPQSGTPCDVGGKVADHLQRLSGFAALACGAFGGDSDKCRNRLGLVDLAADTFDAGCALVER